MNKSYNCIDIMKNNWILTSVKSVNALMISARIVITKDCR